MEIVNQTKEKYLRIYAQGIPYNGVRLNPRHIMSIPHSVTLNIPTSEPLAKDNAITDSIIRIQIGISSSSPHG